MPAPATLYPLASEPFVCPIHAFVSSVLHSSFATPAAALASSPSGVGRVALRCGYVFRWTGIREWHCLLGFARPGPCGRTRARFCVMGPLFSLRIHRTLNIHALASLYRQHPFSFQNGSSAPPNPLSTSTSTSSSPSPSTNTTTARFRRHPPPAPLPELDRV